MNLANPTLTRLNEAVPARPRNREATIRAVLESAQRLFTTKGYDNTSLVDIAGETGLSPRGVILHFSSKADIVAELMIRDLRARAQSYDRDVKAADSIAGIVTFFEWLAEFDRRTFINFPALWSFSARWSEKLEDTVQLTIRELLAPLYRIVEQGMANGTLRKVDTASACEMLWLTYMAGMRRARVRNGTPSDAVLLVERMAVLLRS